jgi:hypothetical protein
MANTIIVKDAEVTVVLSHNSPLYEPFFPNKPKTLTFTGKVVGSADYDEPDTVRITGDKDMPVRVLHFSKILTWNGKKFKYTPDVPKPKRKAAPAVPKYVKVKGSKGNEYTLTITEDRIACSCPGFGFRHTCKHVNEYKESNK